MKTNTCPNGRERDGFRVIRCIPIGLACAAAMLLQACGSTTPVLDAQFGSALMQAKSTQAITPAAPVSAEASKQGAGLPSATESLRGLDLHNTGRSTPSALTAK
ncbi:MAG: hypothetical protein ACOYB2_03890 [Limnohabitans sp.]|jgi:hypothetical protein